MTIIKLGACKFRDPKIAEKVIANHTEFAATVNREGMTEAERKAQVAALATLAHKWGVEAVGRYYPTDHRRSGGYHYTRAGRWYVVRDGVRYTATSAQARALNSIGVSGYRSVGPVTAEQEG